MNKIKKVTLTFGTTIFFIGTIFSQNVFADTTSNATTISSSLIFQRLSGLNRYETSIAIAKQGWKTSDVVVLASGNSFADGLCAAPLAKLNNAPILLTAGNGLEDAVKSEIQSLGATKIFIIGGTGVISTVEETSLNVIAPAERIAGINRYETSVKVAKKLGSVSQIAVASGEGFADALSIASIAAEEGMPVLLTQRDMVSTSLVNYIKTQSISKTYIIGGTGVLGSSIETSLPAPERISGANRFETNLNVLNKFKDHLDFQNAFVAGGTVFADALSGAALAAKYASPLVLTTNSLPVASEKLIKQQVLSNSNIFLLGGTAVLPESIKDQLNLNNDSYIKDSAVYGGANSSASQEISNNISLDGNSIDLENANLAHNLYIYKATTLKNITIKGTLYINVSTEAAIKLENVTADTIRIISGNSNNITCTNVSAKLLQINSLTNGKFNILTAGTVNDFKITIGTTVAPIIPPVVIPVVPPVGSGSIISASTIAELQIVEGKLPAISGSLTSGAGKALVTQVQGTISNLISNPSYDYTNDGAALRASYNSLTDAAKSEFNTALLHNLSLGTLVSLKSVLGL